MTAPEKKRILIIEDEIHIAEGLKLNLTLQGHQAEIAADGHEGLRMWKAWQPDLIVLDIMLPGLDGLSLLQNIRIEDERLPVLILSAKGSPKDRIRGFTYGVDDYLAKPFDLEEFLLRVERLLTRTSWKSDAGEGGLRKSSAVEGTYRFGANEIDFVHSTARTRRGEISLTEQEIKLLKIFILNRGKPVTRGKLLRIGWGYTRSVSTRTVDNFMVRLRKYFEKNPREPVYFKSLRSVGYMFDHDGGSGPGEPPPAPKDGEPAGGGGGRG